VKAICVDRNTSCQMKILQLLRLLCEWKTIDYITIFKGICIYFDNILTSKFWFGHKTIFIVSVYLLRIDS